MGIHTSYLDLLLLHLGFGFRFGFEWCGRLRIWAMMEVSGSLQEKALAEPIGVAGFGRGALSLPAQPSAYSPNLGSQFSYCLISHSFDSHRVSQPSPLILGRRVNPPVKVNKVKQVSQPQPFAYTPMLENTKHPYYYYVGLEAVTVGKNKITAPLNKSTIDENGNGGMVVDSGTTYSMLPEDLYNSIMEVILKRDDLALVVNIEFVPLIVEEDGTGPLIELRDHTFGLGGFAWYYTHAYIENGVTFIAIRNLTFLAKVNKVKQGNCRMVVDSGMTYSMLPEDLYNSVVGEFGKSGNKRERGVEVKTKARVTTWISPLAVLMPQGPQLVLHFGGNSSVVMPKKNYFYEFTDGKKVKRKVGCMTLMNAGYFSGSGGITGLLGNYQQQGLEVVYDLLNKRVGLARRKCSSLWDTLG
nr:probable aspartyl protease At4g16563 [Tanacetum cinerariifolium]